MAINKKGLKDLFGDSDSVQDSENNFFDEEQSDTSYQLDFPDNDDDLLPAAPVLRNPDALPVSVQNVNADIDYALNTQNDLINQSQKLIQIALNNASEGGTARDIEVASNAILNASKAIEGLIAIHEKISKLNGDGGQNIGSGNTFVQNQIVYQGTTTEALKALKNGDISIDSM